MDFSLKVIISLLIAVIIVLLLSFILQNQTGGAESYLGSIVNISK